MSDFLSFGLIVIGIFFVLVGSLGVLRFEDVFLRLQASSKSLTLGLGGVILGAAINTGDGQLIAKALLVVLFQFITSPIAAQMIARAALRHGIVPSKVSHIARIEDNIAAPKKLEGETCD